MFGREKAVAPDSVKLSDDLFDILYRRLSKMERRLSDQSNLLCSLDDAVTALRTDVMKFQGDDSCEACRSGEADFAVMLSETDEVLRLLLNRLGLSVMQDVTESPNRFRLVPNMAPPTPDPEPTRPAKQKKKAGAK